MPNFLEKLDGENNTKLQIFLTAARLFAEKGYNGVSMREISEQSNVSKPTIYYYFGSKEGIFRELLETGMKYGVNFSREIAASNIPAKEKLKKIMQRQFRVSYEHSEFSKFFLMIFLTSENIPFVEDFKKHVRAHKKLLMNIFKEGIESGEFGAGANSDLAAEMFVAVTGHFISLQIKSKRKILTNKLAEEIVELLFKGLNE
ncbi:MAG: TetR/AcrR family transcriptional regulator [Calditrichaeota bacterium]|nr:TetR/AcrR family transcriptional regulator [Calditrichota bacterium]